MSKEFNFSLDEEKKRLAEIEGILLQTAAQHNAWMGRLEECKERIKRMEQAMADAAKAVVSPVAPENNTAVLDSNVQPPETPPTH